MRIHEVPGDPGKKQNGKRAGRGEGSGLGKSAGRGNKGYRSRAGSKRKTHFEGGQMPYFRRIPKRGFYNIFSKVYQAVNISILEKYFESGDQIDPEALREKGVIHPSETRIKILGKGELTKSFTIKAHAFSKSAMEKINSKGGKCEVLSC
ncbi:50S ribosomal protein L15 [Candidatus Sumerlaeota bacterium]|nr:50S ribosomal protein L15 [Candidatus Sumerlaeota bacterium]